MLIGVSNPDASNSDYWLTLLTKIVPILPAESAGFEPAKGFTPYLVSSEALSAAQPTLRESKSNTKD